MPEPHPINAPDWHEIHDLVRLGASEAALGGLWTLMPDVGMARAHRLAMAGPGLTSDTPAVVAAAAWRGGERQYHDEKLYRYLELAASLAHALIPASVEHLALVDLACCAYVVCGHLYSAQRVLYGHAAQRTLWSEPFAPVWFDRYPSGETAVTGVGESLPEAHLWHVTVSTLQGVTLVGNRVHETIDEHVPAGEARVRRESAAQLLERSIDVRRHRTDCDPRATILVQWTLAQVYSGLNDRANQLIAEADATLALAQPKLDSP